MLQQDVTIDGDRNNDGGGVTLSGGSASSGSCAPAVPVPISSSRIWTSPTARCQAILPEAPGSSSAPAPASPCTGSRRSRLRNDGQRKARWDVRRRRRDLALSVRYRERETVSGNSRAGICSYAAGSVAVLMRGHADQQHGQGNSTAGDEPTAAASPAYARYVINSTVSGNSTPGLPSAAVCPATRRR